MNNRPVGGRGSETPHPIDMINQSNPRLHLSRVGRQAKEMGDLRKNYAIFELNYKFHTDLYSAANRIKH
jgi:hypothetical protein